MSPTPNLHPLRKSVFSALPLALLILVSCSADKKEVSVDLTFLEEGLEYGTEWVVVEEPYAIFRGGPDYNSPATGHGRRGDVEKVLSQALMPTEVTGQTREWYAFEKGWLPDSSVILCSNLFRARQISAAITD